jgi:putative PIN family toxin of toxin-antitoxin system
VRVIIDSNVVVSGLLWYGTPHTLIEHARAGTVTLISSPALLAELAEVIHRSKFQAILARTNTNPERMLMELRQLAEIIDPPPLPTPISSSSAPMPASPLSMPPVPSPESAAKGGRRPAAHHCRPASRRQRIRARQPPPVRTVRQRYSQWANGSNGTSTGSISECRPGRCV